MGCYKRKTSCRRKIRSSWIRTVTGISSLSKNISKTIVFAVALSSFLTVSDIRASEISDFELIEKLYREKAYENLMSYGRKFAEKHVSSVYAPDVLRMMAELETDLRDKVAILRRIQSEYSGSDAAAKAHLQLGEIYLLKGEFSMAANEFSAIEANYAGSPSLDDAVYKLGLARLGEGSYEKARQKFAAVLRTSPGKKEASKAGIALVETYRLEGNTARSITEYTRMLRSGIAAGLIPRARFNLALAYHAAGKTEECRELLESILSEYPSSLEAESAKTRLGLMNGKYTDITFGDAYYLQAGVFYTLEEAERYGHKLINAGEPASIAPGEVYKVVIGPFNDGIEAQIYSRKLWENQGIDSFLIEK